MLKSVIKEVFIILLLSIAILLVLGILFYDYIPTNRVVPTKKAYSTPEEVKNEIEEEVTETEKVEVSYEVTDADLNIYKQSNSYVPGKRDPFSMEETQPTGNATGGTSTNNEETVETNTNSDPNSTGTFFNDTGKK